ncbi:MAG TPA: hypothetical protein VFX44_00010 [Solirubrobacterales bacterium]|nr:hypothetical protein [Solirubrobacterales bacterium]
MCLGFLYLTLGLLTPSQTMAAERPPYEFSAQLSLTGGCGTSNADPVPDPGCPEKKPPKPFGHPEGIAIDSFGDEYVASYGAEEGKQGRIDVFSPEGVFITEVKDELGPKNVAVDSKGVLYVFDQSPGHDGEFARFKPKVYEPAEGKTEYGSRELIAAEPGPSEAGIAVDSNDHVFVDWPERGIKEYSSAAEGNELKATITSERLKSSVFIALDKQRRRLYASSCPNGDITECWVLVFSADEPHELLKEIKGPNPTEEGFFSQKGWTSIAVDEATGDFFIGDLSQTKNVYQYNEKYEHVSVLALNPELFEAGGPLQIAVSNAKDAFNEEYLFVPSPKNRALAFHPPEEFEPEIITVSAAVISEDEAELQAMIKPDGGETTYRFEYLSQQEYEEAGKTLDGAKLAGEGMIAPSEQEVDVKAPVNGLEPGVAYRFQVSAENGAGSGEAKEGTFTTYDDAPITAECPEAIRTSHSTLLPDCRAYELVTPADMGGQPPTGSTFAGDNFPSVKASPSGNAVSFLTHGGIIPSLGGAGSFNGNPYRTTRTSHGWITENVGPNGAETTYVDQGGTSPDQGYSFWSATHEGSAVIGGEDTRYVRYPDGHSELIGRGEVEGEERTDPRARGKLITENGTHIVFQTRPFNSGQPIQLEPEAAPTGTSAVYDRTADEVTHVVSIRPDGKPFEAGQDAAYVGASADGEGIAFSVGKKLYLRVGNATTFEIGEGLTFAGVSEGGARIFYLEGGDLFAFDVATEEAIQFTETGNAVPVNVAADGTRAYFISTTAIGGSGENPNGAGAQAGKENLYLSEEGAIRFVGTVTERDVVGEKITNGTFDGLGLWASALVEGQPAKDPSRTNPDGSVLLFQSRANLDGYAHENIPEIYRYDSVSERLHCVSCIPTKVAAAGGASLESYLSSNAPFTSTGFVQNLRADGKRAVFQSTEALVSRDNDGVQDVYEWEEQGVGSCTRSGGCVYLISSGQSAKDNYLYASSKSGDDVFFTTVDILVGGDNDGLSIYDARVNGGFPEETKEECMGEGCRSDLSGSPVVPAPVTGATGKSGNVTSKPCPKGKHKATRKGKRVCIKNKKHHRRHHKARKGAGK